MNSDFLCNLCGSYLYGRTSDAYIDDWNSKVRALYITEAKWSSPTLSGVGLHFSEHAAFLVPRDEDSQYNFPTENALTWMPGNAIHIADMVPNHTDATNLSNEELLEPHGFLFHDACWNILQAACRPAKVNIQTLMRIFRSFSTSHGVIDWGHDYGNLAIWSYGPDDHSTEKGERVFQYMRDEAFDQNGFETSLCDISLMDPLHIPWLEQLYGKSVGERKDGEMPRVGQTHLSPGQDCFSILVQDIRDHLLTLLPPRDVRNLFLASRTMSQTELTQFFWKSRFCPGMEFEYMFEPFHSNLYNFRSNYLDWKSLYFGLRELVDRKDIGIQDPTTFPVLGLQNRNRIWGLMQQLASVVTLLDGVEPQGEPRATFWEPKLPEDNLSWQTFEFCQDDEKLLHAGYHTMFSRIVHLIPSKMTAVRVHRIHFPDDFFHISGLTFYHENGNSTQIGYTVEGNDVLLDLDLDHDERLRGFYASFAWYGFKALALATNKVSDPVDWAGVPVDSSREAIILKDGDVRVIKADFDGVRMVGLSIPM